MTIKEIEQHSGLERASIRFYEQQGLLSPGRAENGYRDYSEQDLVTLERVRFLRSLGFGVQEILSFQREERALNEALPGRIRALEGEQCDRERACRICRELQADHASYQTLETERYLRASDAAPVPPPADRAEAVRSPWRRLFARLLDSMLAGTLFWGLVILLFRLNLQEMNGFLWDVAFWAASLGLRAVLEPLWLHLAGTTPGKALLGLGVESPNGGRLSLQAARERTWDVLWYGEGANLPVYSLYRNWQSYRACTQEETLPWEEESVLTERPLRPWRVLCAAGAAALCLCAMLGAAALAALPPCRGELTVEQYARNYNAAAAYYGEDSGRLDENGQWQQAKSDGAFVILTGAAPQPEIEYDLDADGIIRRVTWRYRYEITHEANRSGDAFLFMPDTQLLPGAVAYAGAGSFQPFYPDLQEFFLQSMSTRSLQFGETQLTLSLQGGEGKLIMLEGLAVLPEKYIPATVTLQLLQER